jgi:type I restriction enzyme S subunit
MAQWSQRTNLPSLRKSIISEIDIPIAPLPVQERIVAILQKADAIRQKRKEALRIAEQIIPSLFLEMFGDPATNPKGCMETDFDECILDITREFKKVQQHEYKDNVNGKYPVIDQGEKYIGGYIDETSLLYTGNLPIIVFGDHTRRFKFVDFPFVLGADGAKVLRTKEGFLPEFLFYHLLLNQIPNHGYERHFKFVREMRFMNVPIEEQKHFASIFHIYRKRYQTIISVYKNSEEAFRSLLTCAFTGELTSS